MFCHGTPCCSISTFKCTLSSSVIFHPHKTWGNHLNFSSASSMAARASSMESWEPF